MGAENPDLPAPTSSGPSRDTAPIATRDDLSDLKYELSTQIRTLEARLADRLQFQGWALLAGVAVLLAIAAAVIELL